MLTNLKRNSKSLWECVDDHKLMLHIRKIKTGKKRDVACRSNTGQHMLDFLKYQRKYLDEHLPSVITDDDSLVFGISGEHFDKTLSYRRFNELWTAGLNGLSLEGNRFST